MRGGASVFDSMTCKDLILAFFPCIYFETIQLTFFALVSKNMEGLSDKEKIDYAMDRLDKRSIYHKLLYKMYGVCKVRGLRLIIENPATPPNYLITGQNFPSPTFIDNNRMMRGDYMVKPTAYWFINAEPTHGYTEQLDKLKEKKTHMTSRASKVAGLCSEERSMISPDYARNFICDFIIGKEQIGTQLSMF